MEMRLLRVLGWLLIAAAMAALAYDAVGWSGAEPMRLTALGELWFKIDRSSLNLAASYTALGLQPRRRRRRGGGGLRD
jgi:hypothetical protein